MLPFRSATLAETIDRYLKEVTKLAADLRDQTAETNRRIEEGRCARSPIRPGRMSCPRRRNLSRSSTSPIYRTRSDRLQQQARAYDEAQRKLIAGGTVSNEVRQATGALLVQAERAMTSAKGLPRRPWFTHQIYAPGFYTGYGVKTMPGVREAVEQHDWKEAAEQITLASGVLARAAAEIDRATALLQGSR